MVKKGNTPVISRKKQQIKIYHQSPGPFSGIQNHDINYLSRSNIQFVLADSKKRAAVKKLKKQKGASDTAPLNSCLMKDYFLSTAFNTFSLSSFLVQKNQS
jgi:hypothetical protein